MFSATRALLGAGAILLMLVGLATLVAGQPGPGLWAIVVGAIGLIAVAFERTRYRSEAADRHAADATAPGGGEDAVPPAPFEPTDETFLDPTTRRKVRVYLDPRTGERRYHAEP